MNSFEKQALKQEAHRRLRAQRQRAGCLRVRVVTIALIGFVLLWGVILAQMATGRDPVLGDKSPPVAASPAGKDHPALASGPPVESTEIDDEGDDDSDQAASEAIEATGPEELGLREAAELEAAEAEAVEVEPAPVTTSQS
jgi:hypothetical protein